MNLSRKFCGRRIVYNGPMATTQAEFVRLLTQHSSQLFGFILALTANRADAEDVFQNTSVVLWEKFDAFEPGTSFYSWACRVAYFEALYHRRKTKRMKTISDEAWHALANHALAMSDAPDAGEEALADCLEKLSPAERDILEKKYYAKQSVVEIAAACSKSVHSVYRTLSRVHDQLLECVRRKLAAD